MPSINRSGPVRILMGIEGKGRVSVDREVPPALAHVPAQRGLGWISSDKFPFQAQVPLRDASGAVVIDPETGEPQLVAVVRSYCVTDGQMADLALRGADKIIAGDGVWAIWSGEPDKFAPDKPYGYLDSFWRHRPAGVSPNDDWVPVAVHGGVIYVKLKHHGPDVYGRWDGTTLVPVDRLPVEPWSWGHVPGHGLAVWPTGDRTQGMVLSPDGRDHAPDLRVLDDGRLVVASSFGAGERAGEIRSWIFDPATKTKTDLTKYAFEGLEVRRHVPAFAIPNHRIRVAVFGEPGLNLDIRSTQHDDDTVEPWGVWVNLNAKDEAERLKRSRPNLPTFLYSDEPVFDRARFDLHEPNLVEPVRTLQFYPPHKDSGETIDGRKQTILETIYGRPAEPGLPKLSPLPDEPLAFVVPDYRQIHETLGYSWSVADALEMQRWAFAIAAKDPRVKWVLAFHQDRAGGRDGVVSRPEFAEAVTAMKAAAAAWTPDAPDEPHEPPAPDPVPQPVPTVSWRALMPEKRYAARYRGQFLSSEPGRDGIEFRDAAGGWEKLRAITKPNKRVRFEFVDSGLTLCDEGVRFWTRPSGTDGSWEDFIAGVAPSGEPVALRSDFAGTGPLELVEVPA